MHFRSLASILLFSLLAMTAARAVKVDWPGRAESESTHIVVGTVTAIYSKITRDESYETTHCLAEVRIESVEKGDGLKADEIVCVRYIGSMRWIGKEGLPMEGPHRNVPKEGEKLKICLVQNADKSLDVYYISGFKKLEPPK